jgi:hypothetical protein
MGRRNVVRIVFTALALSSSAQAQTLEIVEGAHELSLGLVSLPDNTSGTLIFKTCAACEVKSLRVTTSTTYRVATGPLALPELRERVDALKNSSIASDEIPVTVFYSMATGDVTRVSVHDNNI